MRAASMVILCLLIAGCGRAFYRNKADQESYPAIIERAGDPQWALPRVSIDPPRESRLSDPFNKDYPPLPPDDPAAHRYMECADEKKGSKHWHKDGDASTIESPDWRDHLSLSADGVLRLTPDRAVELGFLHSREHQTALEELYLAALDLTLDRFEFDCHWFGRNTTAYDHFGTSSLPTESNTLTTTSQLGFSRAFTTGGQLLVDFANTFMWEFTGPDVHTASSNISVGLMQPLLRGAFREVRMERLTQGERDLLYAVRRFARFRKEYSVNITTRGGGYLSLLLQTQSIRNFEANLRSLQQNLELHESLEESGIASSIQVDTVFQSVQQGRLSLLRAQTALDNALDEYKSLLGLPPGIPVVLDDSLLAPFQLNDPALTALQDEAEKFLAEYRELDAAPTLVKLEDGFGRLKSLHKRAGKMLEQVTGELNRWKQKTAGNSPEDAPQEREKLAQEALTKRLEELILDLKEISQDIDKSAAELTEDKRKEAWEALQKQANDLILSAAELFVLQTQIRVNLIDLKPIGYDLASATEYGLSNRLDLMNQQGRVVDAWRQIRVAADGLESDLEVFAEADIATEPGGSNPVKFSAAANRYRVGLRFDGPLNRKIERNTYRRSLVNYQRARRAHMALDDQIQQAIRRDLRQLENERLNFEIARQSLIAAARQVENARDQLLLGEGSGSASTQDVLNALNALLSAKNTLIGSWVSYETGRIQLLLDLEALQLDERGVYTDEQHDTRHRPSPPGDVDRDQRPAETTP